MVAIRTIVLNLPSTVILQKKNLKTSYKSYQMWRPVDLKIQSRLISLESDILMYNIAVI